METLQLVRKNGVLNSEDQETGPWIESPEKCQWQTGRSREEQMAVLSQKTARPGPARDQEFLAGKDQWGVDSGEDSEWKQLWGTSYEESLRVFSYVYWDAGERCSAGMGLGEAA